MALLDYRLSVFGLLGGSLPWSFSMRMTSSASQAAIATALDTAIGVFWDSAANAYKTLCNADVTLEGSSVVQLNGTQHEFGPKVTTARHVAGTNANPSLPFDNAVVIGFTGQSVAKTDRGRIRLPAPAVDSVGSHIYTVGFIGHVNTNFANFGPAVRAGAGTFYSANAAKLVDGTAPYTHNTLDTYHVSNKPGIMKRRVSKIVPAFVGGAL
jgi:hypothetical protein